MSPLAYQPSGVNARALALRQDSQAPVLLSQWGPEPEPPPPQIRAVPPPVTRYIDPLPDEYKRSWVCE